MKELQDIVKAFEVARKAGYQAALATVLHVEGASYRRAGARMLITELGQLTGAISGGCLKGDALRKARLAMSQMRPMLVSYDTNDEDDSKLGVQLGCKGIIHILIEPILPAKPDNPIALIKSFLGSREPSVVITIFNMAQRRNPQPGTCMLMNADGHKRGSLPKEIDREVINDAVTVLENRNTSTKTYSYQREYTCFIELLHPSISLVVAGAGNDALPLTQMAVIMGWKVTLVDGRPNYNTTERFPNVDRLITAKPEDVLSQISVDSQTVFVLMTHNYNYELAFL